MQLVKFELDKIREHLINISRLKQATGVSRA